MPRLDAAKEYERISGVDARYFLKDYYEMEPLMSDNPQFMFAYGKALRDVGRYNDSNAALRKGAWGSTDPMFHVLMGNNYKDMGFPDLAEESYTKAFRMLPNRLYPLYRLMLLYRDTGQDAKAVAMAHKIKDFKEKITSPATRDMKASADSLLYAL